VFAPFGGGAVNLAMTVFFEVPSPCPLPKGEGGSA
jgi:hypothetical protein